MNESRTYISISHAASLANVSKETIRNLCKRGAIGYEMHANLVYPCKEDVERYAESIATVHASEQELERYKLELQEQVEQLRLAKTDAQTQLDALKLYPHRIKHIRELLCALIPHLDKSLNPRQIEVIMEMLQGGSWTDVSAKLGLTRDRATQIFDKALKKLAEEPGWMQAKDEFIEELQKKILELENIQEEKQRLENLTPEEKVLLHTPISSNALSVRCQNGLKSAEITNLYDLLRHTPADLLALRNFGKKSLAELEAWLASQGLSLKTD